ncbi:DNA-binding protein [Pseudomonas otitidis]|uniref:DNA-binding protein n=1 Tax=Metapseudomonas otitidis TaxID=319939 RepID=UPI002E7C058D|nr:DNA-binding protein [Pseudomonas otitidis]MEE1895677.1 DNA-binding protein [Pseudomonas otitidis]
MQALLTVDQLSIYLQKSVASIRSDVTRNPLALPPICRLPGTKRLLWRVEDVEQWLAEHVVSVDAIASTTHQEKTRRGRPSKAEQVSRQRRLVR